jgi:hypothetical protein
MSRGLLSSGCGAGGTEQFGKALGASVIGVSCAGSDFGATDADASDTLETFLRGVEALAPDSLFL